MADDCSGTLVSPSTCSNCKSVFSTAANDDYNPMKKQTCGHRLCRKCANEVGNKKNCPVPECDVSFGKLDLDPEYINVIIRQVIITEVDRHQTKTKLNKVKLSSSRTCG
jgi:hypothetical protein